MRVTRAKDRRADKKITPRKPVFEGPDANRDRWKHYAKDRTAKAIEKIRLLNNLSNTVIYEATETEIEHVVSDLEAAVAKVKERLRRSHLSKEALEEPSTLRVRKAR